MHLEAAPEKSAEAVLADAADDTDTKTERGQIDGNIGDDTAGRHADRLNGLKRAEWWRMLQVDCAANDVDIGNPGDDHIEIAHGRTGGDFHGFAFVVTVQRGSLRRIVSRRRFLPLWAGDDHIDCAVLNPSPCRACVRSPCSGEVVTVVARNSRRGGYANRMRRKNARL